MAVLRDLQKGLSGALALREKALLGLVAVLFVISLVGWSVAVYRGFRLDSADARKETAQVREAEAVQGARDASDYSSEMIRLQGECANEMARVAVENEAALKRARAEGERAGREQEAYERSLAAPQDLTCNTFAEAKVCKEWMNY